MSSTISPQFYHSHSDPALKRLREEGGICFENDIFQESISELFDIEHPDLKPEHPDYSARKSSFLDELGKKGELNDQGVWVYYPWSKTLVHFPEEEVYLRLRSSRNRNLITEDERKVFQAKTVAIAGLSVGSNILNTLVLISGPRHIKIADQDTISVPNLNRIMANAASVGLNKAEYFARKALEVDPFLKIEVFSQGLTAATLEDFLVSPKVDLLIEEMDNAYLKVEIRKIAKANGVPVIMAADNGDGVLVDIERFDEEPDRPLFHGRLEQVVDVNSLSENLSFPQKMVIIASIVNLAEATPRAQESLGEVGKTLNTWPQLGTAALMAGVVLTFVARRILLGLPVASGRYSLGLEEYFVPDYNSSEQQQIRKQQTDAVMDGFNRLLNQLINQKG